MFYEYDDLLVGKELYIFFLLWRLDYIGSQLFPWWEKTIWNVAHHIGSLTRLSGNAHEREGEKFVYKQSRFVSLSLNLISIFSGKILLNYFVLPPSTPLRLQLLVSPLRSVYHFMLTTLFQTIPSLALKI